MAVLKKAFFLLSFIFFVSVPIVGQTAPVLVEEAREMGFDLSQVERLLGEVNRDVERYLPQLSIEGIISNLKKGQLGFGLGDLWQGLLRFLLHELMVQSNLLGKLIVLAVLSAVLQHLESAFEQGRIARLGNMVVFMAMVTLALGSFTQAVEIGRGVVEQMATFTQAMLPLVLTLTAASGGVLSVGAIHPILTVALAILGVLIKDIVFPLIYLGAVLTMINHLTDRFRVTRLAGFLNQVNMGLLGLFMTVFIGLLSLQGVAGSVADGVAMKTAEFVVGAFVPVVGGAISDALGALAGTSLLLRNAVGIAGALGVAFIAVFPAIKLLSLVVIYKLAGALVQPIGDNRMAEALDSMGNAMAMVFATVAALGVAFFLVMAIILGLGNGTAMLR